MKIRFFTIPNLLTLANLLCGCLAIVSALVCHDLQTAFWLVMAAAVFDFSDGMAARLLGSYSDLGVQLDSLSDMVSFGVAPSVVLFCLYTGAGGGEWWNWGAYVVFIVALFSALRLAKFNIDTEQKEEFTGLPTPACAILVASAGWLYGAGRFMIDPLWILVASVVLAYLLISPVRMFSLKYHNFSFGDNMLRYIFLVLSLAGVAVFRIAAVPFIMVGYIVISTVRHMVRRKGV